MTLTCPVCRHELIRGERSYRCSQGHSFDLAKEGYLSLLHGRQSGVGRGDGRSMVQARDRVHRAGIFDPLVAALATLPFETPPQVALELGCGEGFFLRHMVEAHGIVASYGLDISVDAVKQAAKTQARSLILRADLLQCLPFADGSMNLIQSIFAPRPLTEIKRVLSPGGCALFVYPQGDHWEELRAFLPLAKIGEDKLQASDLEGFEPMTSLHVRAPRTLPHAQLVDLVEMSPSIHRLTRDGIDWKELLPATLTATLSVRVASYRKV